MGEQSVTTYLVTWNPDKWEWEDEYFNDAVERTAKGELVADQWSTGSRTGFDPDHGASDSRQSGEDQQDVDRLCCRTSDRGARLQLGSNLV